MRAPENARERDMGLSSDLPLYDQAMYGRVLYVHGGGLDAPLALLRMDYDSIHREPQLVFPHTNALGSYDSGTFGSGGASRGPCARIVVGMETDRHQYEEYDPNYEATLQPDSADHCVNVSWPAQYLWRTHQTRQEKAPWAWNGSLIQNKRDASGQIYMRNRFYDPGTGRFTQEDPIGIAGGLNVYGFAAGDPVNYSDPYGLEAECLRPGVTSCSLALTNVIIRAAEAAQKFGEFLDANPEVAEAYLPDVAPAPLMGVTPAERKVAGRLGSAATRRHVAHVANELESRGWSVVAGGGRAAEEYIPGPGGGRRGSSYPDITSDQERPDTSGEHSRYPL